MNKNQAPNLKSHKISLLDAQVTTELLVWTSKQALNFDNQICFINLAGWRSRSFKSEMPNTHLRRCSRNSTLDGSGAA